MVLNLAWNSGAASRIGDMRKFFLGKNHLTGTGIHGSLEDEQLAQVTNKIAMW